MNSQELIKRVAENLAQIVASKQGEAIYSRSVNAYEVFKQTIDLSTARTREAGNGITIPAWTSIRTLSATDENTRIFFSAGEDYDGKPLDELRDEQNVSSPYTISTGEIFNTAQAGKSITVIAYRGLDFKSSLARIVGSGNFKITRPSGLNEGSVGSINGDQIVLAARTSRDKAFITNDTGVEGWVIGIGAPANSGRLILPSQTLEVTHLAGINFRSTVVVANGIKFTEEFFV